MTGGVPFLGGCAGDHRLESDVKHLSVVGEEVGKGDLGMLLVGVQEVRRPIANLNDAGEPHRGVPL